MLVGTELQGFIGLHDGEKVISRHACTYKYLWEDYEEAFGGVKEQVKIGDKTFPCIWIPAANAMFKKAMPLPCLFNATKGLAQNLWGTSLDDDDRKFFEDHPLASESGVSLPDTLRVVQEIIEPYNLRVSRVHFMPGTPINGDLLQWLDVLGMNPVGLADMQTDNETFAKLVNLPLEQINAMYRMQYSEKPLRPCILCAVAPMRADSTTGINLGHAEYVGPRAKREGHEPIMQVQIGRAESTPWKQLPTFPAVPDVVPTELDLNQTIGPDGKKMYSYRRKSWNSYNPSSASTHGAHGGTNARVGAARQGPSLYVGDRFECYVCNSHEERKHRVGANLCRKCWDYVWKQWSCGECTASLKGCTLRGLTNPSGNTDGDWKFLIDCPVCHEENTLTILRNSKSPKMQALYRVSAALRAVKVVYS